MRNFNEILELIKHVEKVECFGIRTNLKNPKIFKYNIEAKIIFDRMQNAIKMYEGKLFKEYSYDMGQKDYLEKITCEALDVDTLIINPIEDLPVSNQNAIEIPEINAKFNIDVIRVKVKDEVLYFVTKHSSLNSAFKNKVVFNGLRQIREDKILAFSEYPDVIIFNEYCYILHENKFNTIFNFRERIDKMVIDAKEEILSWEFLDDPLIFYESCDSNYNYKRSLVTAINKNSSAYLKNASPSQIKGQIEKHPEFVGKIFFDANSKIKTDKKSTRFILQILTNKIGLDVFTEKPFGLEEESENEDR